jgi:CRISPR-associated protein Cas2
MLHIIAYDITDGERLRKVSQICLDYGIRIQYSIFQFDLNENLTNKFINELKAIIDPQSDKIMIVPICKKCKDSILYMGKMEPFSLPLLYMF